MLFRSCAFPFSLVFPLQFCFGPCLNLTRNMVYDRKTVMEAFVSVLMFLICMCVSIAVFLWILFETQPQHVIKGKPFGEHVAQWFLFVRCSWSLSKCVGSYCGLCINIRSTSHNINKNKTIEFGIEGHQTRNTMFGCKSQSWSRPRVRLCDFACVHNWFGVYICNRMIRVVFSVVLRWCLGSLLGWEVWEGLVMETYTAADQLF